MDRRRGDQYKYPLGIYPDSSALARAERLSTLLRYVSISDWREESFSDQFRFKREDCKGSHSMDGCARDEWKKTTFLSGLTRDNKILSRQDG